MPPPPAPPPPPQPCLGAASAQRSAVNAPVADQDRNQLLSAIRRGKNLKKTVTVDKSDPFISKSSHGSDRVPEPSGSDNMFQLAKQNIGGLFAGGMPSLKPTNSRFLPNAQGKQNTGNSSDNHQYKLSSKLPVEKKVTTQSIAPTNSSMYNTSEDRNQTAPPSQTSTAFKVHSHASINSVQTSTAPQLCSRDMNCTPLASTTQFVLQDKVSESTEISEVDFESRFSFHVDLPPPEPFLPKLRKQYPSQVKKEPSSSKTKPAPQPPISHQEQPPRVPSRPVPSRPAPLPPRRSAPDRPPPPRPFSRPAPAPPPRKT